MASIARPVRRTISAPTNTSLDLHQAVGRRPQAGRVGGGRPEPTFTQLCAPQGIRVGARLVHRLRLEEPVNHQLKLGAVLLAAAAACGGSDNSSGPLGNIDSLVILQRQARN